MLDDESGKMQASATGCSIMLDDEGGKMQASATGCCSKMLDDEGGKVINQGGKLQLVPPNIKQGAHGNGGMGLEL